MRFAASVQRSGAAMKAINAILKKPARDEAAFRHKLEEISAEAAHIRREAMTLHLAGLETAARTVRGIAAGAAQPRHAERQ
jgi:aspartyl/asparaginyl beta-hydroxylase (cupin superfamily)